MDVYNRPLLYKEKQYLILTKNYQNTTKQTELQFGHCFLPPNCQYDCLICKDVIYMLKMVLFKSLDVFNKLRLTLNI